MLVIRFVQRSVYNEMWVLHLGDECVWVYKLDLSAATTSEIFLFSLPQLSLQQDFFIEVDVFLPPLVVDNSK